MTAQPPPGYGPAPQPWGGPGGAGSYGAGSYAGPPRTDTKAVVALVLAVLAWTPTVPFLGAIGALVLVRMSRRDIRASGGRLTGLRLCTWAAVLSWVHLVFLLLVGVLLLAVFVLPFSLGL